MAISGDFIYGSWPEDDRSPLEIQPFVLPFLNSCANLAPTYVSLGNHEQKLDEEDLALVRSTGVTLLDNEYTYFTVDKDGQEKKVLLTGLTSAYVTDFRRIVDALRSSGSEFLRYPKKEDSKGLTASTCGIQGLKTASERLPDASFLSSFAAVPADYRILLCHHPEYISYVPDSVDLILSGHAHGGQWRIFGHGVFAPGQGWWPKYTKGVYDDRLIVSAGLANTAKIPRINNPVEIVYITPPPAL